MIVRFKYSVDTLNYVSIGIRIVLEELIVPSLLILSWILSIRHAFGYTITHISCPSCGRRSWFFAYGTYRCNGCGAEILIDEKDNRVVKTLKNGSKMFWCSCSRSHLIKELEERIVRCDCGRVYYVRNCSPLIITRLPSVGKIHGNFLSKRSMKTGITDRRLMGE